MARIPDDLRERVRVTELRSAPPRVWLVTLEVDGVKYSASGAEDALRLVSEQSLINNVLLAAVRGLAATPPNARKAGG